MSHYCLVCQFANMQSIRHFTQTEGSSINKPRASIRQSDTNKRYLKISRAEFTMAVETIAQLIIRIFGDHFGN